MSIKIVIIIPTYGDNPLLKSTLQSLSECTFPSHYVKTIIIENGKKYSVEELVSQYRHLKFGYQYFERANKSAALNQAIEEVEDNTFILFFDDDVRFSPEVLLAYAKEIENKGNHYYYGGPYGVDYEHKPAGYYYSYMPFSARGWEHKEKTPLMPTSFIGFNWAVCVNKIKEAGGFDPKFGPNSSTGATGQEHEMMQRLYQAGIMPCYVKDAKVWHYVPREKSTFRWTLMRKYKGGKSIGISQGDTLTIRDLRKQLAHEYLMLLKSALQFSRSKTIFYLVKTTITRGVLDGVKIYNKK
jgi:glycosyltransferase involved in cell wall biosynthesis